MAQIKIYALHSTIQQYRQLLSDAIHQAVISALSYPPEKKFQRFIALQPEDFIYPADRSQHYTIIEIFMFEGRSTEAKKALIRTLYSNIQLTTSISMQDIEITIVETPKANWGIRGLPGDELSLGYRVEV